MKHFITTSIVSALMLIMFSNLGWGQIAGWDFSTQPGGSGNYGTSPLAVTTKDANITVGGLTRGSGFGTLTGTGAGSAWGSTNFTNAGTLSGEISANKFFTFTITANTNYKVSISGIAAYNIRRSSTGPTTGQWQYQIGTGSFVNIGSAITWGTVTTSAGNPQSAIDLSGVADLQNVLAGTTITFRLVCYGASAITGTNYLKDLGNTTSNDFIINGTVTPVSTGTPTITTSSTMTNFGNIVINSTSTVQNYSVSGTNLTSDIVIKPPTGFQISALSSPFTPVDSINLTPSSGTVTSTIIYVRFAPTLVQSYPGNISHTSSGATGVNVSVSGTGIKGEPTNHATSFAVNSSTASTIQLTWVDATGGTIPDGYILKGSSVDYSSISDPVDGVAETNSTLIKNITAGTQTCTFSGLNGNTVYYFKIFPYTNSGTDINYKTDGTVPSVSGSTADGSVSTDYFRSVNSGNWNNSSNWQSSHDNSTWISSTLVPDYNANTITILNGHTITITSDITVDELIINGTLIINSGVTLNTNNGTGEEIIINGTMIHSGTVPSPINGTGTINSGGTYIHNTSSSASRMVGFFSTKNENSNWIYRGSSTLTPAVSLGGSTFQNLYFESSSGSWSGNFSAGALTVNGDFLVDNNTTLNIQTTSLNIFKGNFTINGTLVNSTGSQNYSFEGSSQQIIGGTGTFSFSNLRINSFGVTFDKSVTVNGVLTLTSGRLVTASDKKLILGTSATISGGSSTSYIDGPVDINTNSTTQKIVHIGSGTKYRTAGITPATSDATTYSIQFNDYAYSDTVTFTPPLVKVSSREHFIINRTSGSANANVTISWDASAGITNLADIRVGRWNSTSWEDAGRTGFTGDEQNGSITSGIVSSFSPFVIASISDQPLPVHLSSFTSSANRRNITLNWTTASENNNSGFDVERKSADGKNWVKAGFVTGSGTTAIVSSYSFTDRNLNSGKYKYRLKQIDYNGNYEYFELNGTPEVGVPDKYNISQNYPNPFNPTTKIDLDIPFDSKVSLVLYDMAGREVRSMIGNEMKAGYYTHLLDASSLSSGVYFYRVVMNSGKASFVQSKKMVLIK